MELLTFLVTTTSLLINLYTLFTIRRHIGIIAKQGLEKVKDKLDKIV